jgi:hypothetical protein
MTSRTNRTLCLLLLLLVALPASFAARTKVKEVIWRDPSDMASLNLFYGAGGKAHAPNAKGAFTFIKEDMEATSPKFEVTDARDVRWKVKLGEEPESETAATRFLWAAGYFVDEDYYLAEFKVTGMPTLRRGGNFVATDGTVHRARLERKLTAASKRGSWDWFDNPFIDTRELNGLRIMMSLVNDWDLSTENNSIEDIGGERRYLVADVGATFGNTGNSLTRSKSVPRDYEDSAFIEHAAPDFVDFVLHSRPFFLSAIDVNNYRDRTRMEQVTKHIPRADARWLGRRLSKLSEAQIRDGFRAGGYTHEDLETYTRTMRKRIAELSGL